MENINWNMEEKMAQDDFLLEMNSSYDRMYECFFVGNTVNVAKKIGPKNKILDMINHFSSREEYEKCHFLKKILEKL